MTRASIIAAGIDDKIVSTEYRGAAKIAKEGSKRWLFVISCGLLAVFILGDLGGLAVDSH